MTISTELKDAFRWHRQLTANRAGHYPAKTALAALESARKDVANGKVRYPSSCNISKLGAPMKDGSRWAERPDAVGLRLVGWCDEVTESRRAIDHKGWYLEDDYSDEVARGVVFQLPARNGKPIYVAGMADPFGNGDSAMVDLRTLWEDDKAGAARSADRLAERYADEERTFRRVNNAACAYSETFDAVKEARARLLEVLDAWRADPVNRTKPEGQTMRKLVCDKVCQLLRERAAAFEKRQELASEFGYSDRWEECLREFGVAA